MDIIIVLSSASDAGGGVCRYQCQWLGSGRLRLNLF